MYAPVKYISLLSPTENTSINHERIFDSSYIQSLQKLCVKKISEYDENSKLLNEVKLEYILYRWKEWDTEQSWVSFINKTVSNISTLVHFTKRFYRTIEVLIN